MEISEAELRAMIRDAIARQSAPAATSTSAMPRQGDASHSRFAIVNGDPDGRCIIEPSVACTHCGYCQSLGH